MTRKLLLIFIVATFLGACGVKPSSLNDSAKPFPRDYPTEQEF